MDSKEKEKAIKKERDKLNRLFQNIPKDSKTLCEGLINNAAFMFVTLNELQEEVKQNGAMLKATSGNGFEIVKDNPAYKAYNTMISRYTVIIKQLSDLLPGDNNAGDELLQWLADNGAGFSR